MSPKSLCKIMLSEDERKKLFTVAKNLIIYKTRNLDAVWLSKTYKELNPKSIAAIKQFHFQALLNGKLTYNAGFWPLKAI